MENIKLINGKYKTNQWKIFFIKKKIIINKKFIV